MQNTIQLPTKDRIWQALCRVSDWVDAKFFPLPKQETLIQKDYRPLFERQAQAEKAAMDLVKVIDKTVSLGGTYNAIDEVRKYRKMYGPTTQVDAAVDSLMLRIYNRQCAIIKALG